MTDKELFRRVLRGNPTNHARAWTAWDRRFRPRALRVAGRVLRHYGAPPDLAEDAVQIAIEKFFRSRERVDPDHAPLSFFLQIVKRTAIDLARREGSYYRVLRQAHRLQAALPARGATDGCEAVEELLRLMPSEERELLSARYLHGLSPGDIANRQGGNVTAVYRMLHKCRCKVRACVADMM